MQVNQLEPSRTNELPARTTTSNKASSTAISYPVFPCFIICDDYQPVFSKLFFLDFPVQHDKHGIGIWAFWKTSFHYTSGQGPPNSFLGLHLLSFASILSLVFENTLLY